MISNTPQVSVTEYHKLQAEIRQLKRDLQVECNTVNPLLSLRGFIISGPLISINLRAGVGGGGCLFNLAITMVSFLDKELEYKVEKLTYKMAGGHATEDQNQISTSSW